MHNHHKLGLNKLGGMILGISLLLTSLAEAAPTRRLGLMVGANDGGKERVRLQYAHSDARGFSRAMEELGGLSPKDRILLEGADSAGMAMALELLTARVKEAKRVPGRVEAVVYYSGHADEEGLLLKGKRFSFRDFRDKMDAIPADVRIAVVDACASGALTRLKGGRALPAFMADKSSHASGYAFLTSSSANEASQESDRIGASFFTHFLTTGLRGAADATQDGRVTLHEAYQYAYHETLARTESTAGGPQHAGYDMRIAGTGDVVMTELSRAEATLALPEAVFGRFFIRDAEERLVAEVQKPSGRELRIALQPGEYTARWHRRDGIQERKVSLKKGVDMVLVAGPEWKLVSREVTVSRGDGDRDGEGTGVDSGSGSTGKAASGDWASGKPKEFQFNPIHNRAKEDFRGTQLTLIYNRADQRLDGQQIAGVVNTACSSYSGMQGAVGVNYAGGHVRGGQVAAGGNIAGGGIEGIQIASAGNLSQGPVEGAQISSGFNIADGPVQGIQATGGFNVMSGALQGAQGSGGFNVAGSMPEGGQGAGGFNIVAGKARGGQGSGGFNVVAGSLEGGQGAGGFNVVAGSLKGGQGAGGFNVVADTMHGGQGAGGFNVVAGSLEGGQGAGGFNIVGGDLKGVQAAGGFNITAGTVDGFQFGVINFAGAYHRGAPIGLLNIVVDGVWRGDAWVDETGFTHLGLVTGTRYVNSRLAVGTKPLSDRSLSAFSLGIEGHIPLEPAFVEVGLLYSNVSDDALPFHREERPDFVNRLRLSLGVDLGPYVSLAGGVSWVVAVTPDDRRPFTDDNWLQRSSFSDRLHQWPGAHLSLRVGTYGRRSGK